MGRISGREAFCNHGAVALPAPTRAGWQDVRLCRPRQVGSNRVPYTLPFGQQHHAFRTAALAPAQYKTRPFQRLAARSLRVVPFDHCQHVRLGDDQIHVGKKALASGYPLLRRKLGFRKADLLHWPMPFSGTCTLYQGHHRPGQLNQRFASGGDPIPRSHCGPVGKFYTLAVYGSHELSRHD